MLVKEAKVWDFLTFRVQTVAKNNGNNEMGLFVLSLFCPVRCVRSSSLF